MIKIKSIQDLKDKVRISQKASKKVKVKIGWRWFLILILILFFGGIAGVIADSLLIPYIITLPRFEKYSFLKPKTKEIIVREKETIKISESEEISEVIRKTKPAVVGIIPKDEIEKSNLFLKSESQGAGVIVTSDGLIVSNKTVVSDPNKTYVVIAGDGTNYESKEIFFDPASDLVFIKIEADNLPVVSFGVSDDLILGQKIIALGNNLSGFQNFASLGIASGLNSFAPHLELVEENLDEVILHDAEINFRNNGGPLLDLSGKVLGINVKMEKEGKTVVYAIPSDFIKKPMADVIKNKKIQRFKIGIRYVTLTPNLASIKKFPKNYGVYLPSDAESVILGSPAAKAGLRRGDIIFAVGEKEIKEKQSFFELMQDYKAGDEVEISFQRKEKEYKTKIKLEE